VEFEWDMPLLEGYRHRFLENRGRGNPGNFFALDAPEIKRILAHERFDAVLVNGWHYKAAWQAMLACWKHHIPVMVRGDSQLPSPRGRLKRLLKYPAYRWFIPRIDACLAVGARSREYYLHYGARPERIFLVPHAIHDEHFAHAARQAEPRRPLLREQWRLDDQQVVFLFAGKFIEVKRPMDFLSAIEAAAGANPRVAGLMVGDGPLRPACEDFVRSRGLPVRFTGFLNQSQIVDAYVAADALVLPSGWETWGIVVNEAMACGRPAFVSDAVGCAPDLVQEGRTGGVFPLRDVNRLAELLAGAAANPGHLRSMGDCARAGLHPYSLEAAVQGVLDAMAAVEKH
jgi:glycosyltransferase involved in cell wall biosynthesis